MVRWDVPSAGQRSACTSWASCGWGWSVWAAACSAGARMWCAAPDAGRCPCRVCPGWATAGRSGTAAPPGAGCSARWFCEGCSGRMPGSPPLGSNSAHSETSWCRPETNTIQTHDRTHRVRGHLAGAERTVPWRWRWSAAPWPRGWRCGRRRPSYRTHRCSTRPDRPAPERRPPASSRPWPGHAWPPPSAPRRTSHGPWCTDLQQSGRVSRGTLADGGAMRWRHSLRGARRSM